MESGVVQSSEHTTTICNLPWEVLHVILKKLDGKSLMVCKTVCKSWRDHVLYLEEKNINFWFDMCQMEIPKWSQFDLLDNLYPTHWEHKTNVNWKTIYIKWSFWKNIYKTAVKTKNLASEQLKDGITAVKKSGDWLLCSTFHGDGVLFGWNLKRPKFWTTIYKLACNPMIGFELVKTSQQTKRNHQTATQGEMAAFFDTLDHNEIWIECRNCYIKLGKSFTCKVDKMNETIRHSYGYQLRHGKGERDIFLNKTCPKVRGPEAMQLEMHSLYDGLLGFWMDTVSLYSFMFTPDNPSEPCGLGFDTFTLNKRSQEMRIVQSGHHLHGYSRHYTWQNTLFVFLTGTRNIIIQEKHVMNEQKVPIEEGIITAAYFYLGYLFLANERGQLMIYKVSQPEDCVNIDIYSSECWTIQLNPSKLVKIIHIMVVESTNPGTRPTVVCASSNEIYQISFPEKA